MPYLSYQEYEKPWFWQWMCYSSPFMMNKFMYLEIGSMLVTSKMVEDARSSRLNPNFVWNKIVIHTFKYIIMFQPFWSTVVDLIMLFKFWCKKGMNYYNMFTYPSLQLAAVNVCSSCVAQWNVAGFVRALFILIHVYIRSCVFIKYEHELKQ